MTTPNSPRVGGGSACPRGHQPRPGLLWLLYLALHPVRRTRPLRTRLGDVAAVIGICALVAAGLRLGDLLHVLAPHALGR